ncbi:hypothetical protein, partial [uncultured Sutterella sp.]|uniref:hypothetical protein n=1 Tax=uncultured Sutterella sp. TaxID=286133 RepID=UPI00266C4FC7
ALTSFLASRVGNRWKFTQGDCFWWKAGAANDENTLGEEAGELEAEALGDASCGTAVVEG